MSAAKEKESLQNGQPDGAVDTMPDKPAKPAAAKEEEEEEDDRGTWSGKLDFLMSSLSFAVGMGNMWRFPYLCYRNGGGAFLIPYAIMTVVLGLPLLYMEMALGQYGRQGIIRIWKICPIFEGLGYSMFTVSAIVCIYYNMLCAWCFFYIFASFSKYVPWATCGHWWNDESCGRLNGTAEELAANLTAVTSTYSVADNITEALNATVKRQSPSDQYFHNFMLGISDGIHEVGAPRWQLVLCLLLCWAIVFLCLSKGIKSQGKVTYVTALFPYVVLLILFIRGITLDGAAKGVIYYLTPDFEILIKPKVWTDAAVQVFFSLSVCWGGQLTMASYKGFHENVMRDAIVVGLGDTLTSIFGGVVIFSFIGYMAETLSVDISKVATQGAGLAFIVYPEAVTTLPISQLWSILFMLMLINVALGTQFGLVQTVQTVICDVFNLNRGRRPLFVLLGVCIVAFLFGLFCTTRNGMYVVQLLDTYAPSYGLLFIGLCLSVCISWVYGSNRFMDNLEHMLGSRPSIVWKIFWCFISPACIVAVLLFTLIDFSRTTYGEYTFPVGYELLGWAMVAVEILVIPGTAIYRICTTRTNLPLLARIQHLCRPASDWGPPPEERNTEAMVPLKDMNDHKLEERA